jgi:hypothetical protein
MRRQIARGVGIDLYVISIAFIVLGLGSCGASLAATVLGSQLPSALELPLGSISGFTVDEDGRIYCAVDVYGRLQQYAADGGFLKGIHIPAAAGTFEVAWEHEGRRVIVATARNRMVYKLSGDLEFVSRARNNGELYVEMKAQGDAPVTRAGAVYTLSNSLLVYPHIVRTDPDGSVHTIVRTPLHLWVVMAPFPALFYLLIGIALGGPRRPGLR